MIRYQLILLLSLFLFACSSQENGQVIHNVNGYTLADNDLKQFEAISFQNGKVLEVGSNEDILENYSGFDRKDGEGQTMLPGLIDAHGHVLTLGFREMEVNLTGTRSLDEALERINDFAEANPDSEWILGRGWNQVLWDENEFPTASDLDEAVGDRPVFLIRIDGHGGWANTMAMNLSNISRETPDVQGGRIYRDDRGDATGIFVGAARSYIENIIPDPTDADKQMALELALENMASNGLTSVHDARTDAETWSLYKSFADEGKLKTRIYSMIPGTGDLFDEMSANGPIHSYANDKLSLRSVKISADGALGSRGAALLDDYSDEPGHSGLLSYDQDELNEMVMKGTSAGFQMNIHAIGDAANRQVLNSFENAKNSLGDGYDLRHRVEHAQIVQLEDIPRFVDLNLVASMQPTHATSDMNMAEDRVGEERMRGAYAWQTFLDQGTVIAGGSDFPVEHVNPFYGLYSAVTRKDHEGMPPSGWYSEQAMSRIEALRAFTVDAAYGAHQEDVIGSLEPGKWADFILIDRDFFEVDASEIWQINVLETWMAGEQVYKAE